MSVQGKYDVVIMGGGPAGIATACTIKALNNKARVCVLDIREGTRRNYGLSIAKDAIDSLTSHLQGIKTLSSIEGVSVEAAPFFVKELRTWKNSVLKVAFIEERLTEMATKLFDVTVVRNNHFRMYLERRDHLTRILENPSGDPVYDELHGYFKDASVIIGADGRHSTVRKAFIGEDETALKDRETLGYFIEVKYQIPGKEEPRSYLNAWKDCSTIGVGFETMGRPKQDTIKPATMHFLVDKETYEAFAEATNENPWSIDMLEQCAANNEKIKKQFLKIRYYLEGKNYVSAFVKRLPVEIYQCKEAALMHKRKVVALTGDAVAGKVFARGVNGAFIESGLLGKAVATFLEKNQEIVDLPQEFVDYQSAINRHFAVEKQRAEFRAQALGVVRKFLDAFTVTTWMSLEQSTRAAVKTMVFACIVFLSVGLALHYKMGNHSFLQLNCKSVNDMLLKVALPMSLIFVIMMGLTTKQRVESRAI